MTGLRKGNPVMCCFGTGQPRKKKRGPLLSIESSWLFKVPGSLWHGLWKNPHIKAPVYSLWPFAQDASEYVHQQNHATAVTETVGTSRSEKAQKPGEFIHHRGRGQHDKIQFPSSQVICSLKLHPGKLTCPKKRDYFNRKYIFQPSFFRGDMLVPRRVNPKKTKKSSIFVDSNCQSFLFPIKYLQKSSPSRRWFFWPPSL